MTITTQEIRKVSVILFIILLIVLSFIIIKPILLSIATGLILAYIFIPIHRNIKKVIKNENLSTLIVSFFLVLIILIPLWFLVPLVIEQAFDLFTLTQKINIRGFIEDYFPTSDIKFQEEITSSIINFIGKITSASIGSLINLLLDLPNIALHIAVVLFVFFYTLRDLEKLKLYVSGLSPLKKENEKALIKQFKEITSSIVFGYIIVGITQGIATGLGLLIFGVPKAMILTIIAILASVFPLIGPWLVWVPVAIYLFVTASPPIAIGFTLYGVLFVSSIDNFIRPYIIARRTGISSVIVLVGMIGGLFVFGILGILFGPLILSYLIVFMTAYKNKTLSDMFEPS